MAEEKIEKETEKTAEVEEVAKPEGESGAEAAAPREQADEAKPETPVEEEKPAESEKSAEPEKPAEPDWKALYALTLADFDNYKKRAARDREDTYRYAEMDILKDVLPAVDNLSLALANAKANKDDPFVKGVQLVYDTLLKSLKEHGAEPFDSVGKDLDTEKMEAIATLPSPDVPEGKVSIESKKGWMLKDKVLRVAQVVVSSGKPGGEK
ncbi:MAG: nucleotide exchange factor GrpE [Kiritimatiellae bacterium]|nr:nucleotide exchange factor GrpE [Kiritimatiellia bacterium]